MVRTTCTAALLLATTTGCIPGGRSADCCVGVACSPCGEWELTDDSDPPQQVHTLRTITPQGITASVVTFAREAHLPTDGTCVAMDVVRLASPSVSALVLDLPVPSEDGALVAPPRVVDDTGAHVALGRSNTLGTFRTPEGDRALLAGRFTIVVAEHGRLLIDVDDALACAVDGTLVDQDTCEPVPGLRFSVQSDELRPGAPTRCFDAAPTGAVTDPGGAWACDGRRAERSECP